MKAGGVFLDFILKEWLVTASGAGLVLTSVYLKNIPDYSIQEVEVLFILFVLFVTVNGLQRSGFLLKLSRQIEKGRAVPLKLVVTTFFLSMVVTNDIALIIIVPLTLTLNIKQKDILIVMEALAANAGSALTPIGNPQNLFIYWFYNLHPLQFVSAIAPFSMAFLLVLAGAALFIRSDVTHQNLSGNSPVNKKAYFYGIFLVVVLMVVLHVFPIAVGMIVIFFALLFDRKALKVDYALLFSFFFFFGFAENVKILLAPELNHSNHVFLLSAIASQVMSNVPATLLFAKFTTNWKGLLWGTNAGGFGSLVGSFANLIAYKIYLNHDRSNKTALFTIKFLMLGYAALFFSIFLHYVFFRMKF